jgi:hypothetical protein
MELARQHSLRGNWQASKIQLEKASQNVFASHNRRQEITLYIRFANLWLKTGDLLQAEIFLRNARRCLDQHVDRSFELAICDLEYQLALISSRTQIAEAAKEKLLKISGEVTSLINVQILARRGWTAAPLSREDQVGNLFEIIYTTENLEERVRLIFESGFLSLLLPHLGISTGIARSDQILYFDLEPGHVTTISKSEIFHSLGPLTVLQNRLLRVLADGASKEKLLSEVWRYKYDPVRHDSLIYSSINKLRSALGPAADWISTGDDWYQIDRRCEVRYFRETPAAADSPRTSNGLDESELNFRQLQILRYLKRQPSIDTSTVREIFKVSEITASRDLSLLTRANRVERIGKARATKYIMAGQREVE